MAITGISSYLPTAALFLNHWSTVNAALGANPLVLPGGMTSGDFETATTALREQIDALPPATSAERQSAAQLKLARTGLQPRFVQFGQAVRLYLGKTRFSDAAPIAPKNNDGERTFASAANNVAARWADINAATDIAPFVPPLTLPSLDTMGGAAYTLADFNTQVTALMNAFTVDTLATGNASQMRSNRDVYMPPVYNAMKTYREAVLLLLPKNSPLRATLPRLTPAPGTTPPPLVVTGAWDPILNVARLTWAASQAKDVLKLQLRGSTMSKYKGDDEEIVADLPANATSWEGNWNMGAPDSFAWFKVYVMTTTDNENGGKAVKIVRPAG